MSVQEKIQQLLSDHPVVLFMKGTAQFPMCGFSGRAVELIKTHGCTQFFCVDVLSDPEIREGIKAYGQWPTVPQLYVKGQLVGGCDILNELAAEGKLTQLLQVE